MFPKSIDEYYKIMYNNFIENLLSQSYWNNKYTDIKTDIKKWIKINDNEIKKQSKILVDNLISDDVSEKNIIHPEDDWIREHLSTISNWKKLSIED